MDSEIKKPLEPIVDDIINPKKCDVTVIALLISLGAEKYIEIFRKNKIGQCTLMELNDEDLIKLGVDDDKIRYKLLEEVKSLPIYNQLIDDILIYPNLDTMEIVNVLEESSQHMHRIYLSMMINTLALKRINVVDCLVDDDKYASKIALSALKHMNKTLNSMEKTLNSQVKVLSEEWKHRKAKKIAVATVGIITVAALGYCFIQSIKNLMND